MSGEYSEIGVDTGSELPPAAPRRQCNYSVVCQGNNVTSQHGDGSMFQEVGSSLANMQIGNTVDGYTCFQDIRVHKVVWNRLMSKHGWTGVESGVALPMAAWLAGWFDKDGTPLYKQTGVRMRRALYGHPDAGLFWEQQCVAAVRYFCFLFVETSPSCYYHKERKLFIFVCVDDFKLSGPLI